MPILNRINTKNKWEGVPCMTTKALISYGRDACALPEPAVDKPAALTTNRIDGGS